VLKNRGKKRRPTTVLIIVSALALLALTAGFISQDTLKTVATDVKSSIENQGKPKFVFDTEKFPDWATVGNVYTNPDDITDDFQGSKDDLPLAGMNVNQCERGSNCVKLIERCEPWSEDKPACKKLAQSTMNTNCFVSVFYNERKVDPEQEVVKFIDNVNSFGGMTIQEVGTKTLTMLTPEGRKEYTLHNYKYKNQGSDTIKQGNAIGYISLSNGHIDIRSICTEASQVDETISVLSAIRLEP